MATTFIYFQDLVPGAQTAVWRQVQQELVDSEQLEARQQQESEADFEQRVWEEVDHYLNTHNLANEFTL
jgi:hypothetical protein